MRAVTVDPNRKLMAAGLVGLLCVSLGAIVFVMYQVIAGDGGPAVGGRAKPFAIPPNATLFNSLSDFERANLRAGELFALTIPEPELNARLSEAIRKQPDLPFRDVTARLLDERSDFNGVVRAAGLELSPTVTMLFFAEAGRLRYQISNINFGPVPVPGVARQAISDTIERQMEGQRLTEKYQVEDIQVRPGFVTLVARMR